jgi:hypothetical protein
VINKALFLAILLLFSTGASTMTFFDAGKVCLFSKISGVITLDGKPAANAKIIRTVNLNKDKVDHTYTDENGHFEMPAVFQRTVTKFLPQEFVATQELQAKHKDKEYRIWYSVKRDSSENTESRGKPLVVTCELNSEERHFLINRSPMHTLCTWDVEPDAPIDWENL